MIVIRRGKLAPAPTLSLSLGALADDPSVQCAAQGWNLLNADVHDREAHALSLLGVRCILTETETRRGRARLMDQIAKDVRRIETQEATS